MRSLTRRLSVVGLTVAVATAMAACGGPKTNDSSSSSSDTIVVGASLPLSGPLAGFGAFQKWGYEHAVKEVNDAGGIDIGGTKRKVELKIVDDKTDPNQVSANTQALISKDNVDGLLGSCTPALVTAGAIVADRAKVPFVTGCAPLMAFSSVQKWTYAWDLFFSEQDAAPMPFQTLEANKAQTNQKVAILHDNGPDGKGLGGQAWPAVAKSFGYNVVANVEFPTDNTDFSAAVQQAKDSGADVLLVDAVTPQAVSIRKQMKTAGYTPKFMQFEKGGEPVQFAQALGNLSTGVGVVGYWDPSFPYPGAADLAKAFEAETGQGASQHIADSYTAAKVLMDAMASAGSTDKQKVNTAIGKTDADYPVGHVKFTDNNVAKLALAEVQWQNGKTVVVHPNNLATGKFLFPAP